MKIEIKKIKELKEELYYTLLDLSEYYDDIRPYKKDSLNNLLDKYFYWASEYNDNYLPNDDGDGFNEFLQCKFKEYLCESTKTENKYIIYYNLFCEWLSDHAQAKEDIIKFVEKRLHQEKLNEFIKDLEIE